MKPRIRSMLGALERAKVLPHSNASLYKHLTETWRLLGAWGASDDACLAGLFHSIYGTSFFRHSQALGFTRAEVAGLIGPQAELIVHAFGEVDRTHLWGEVVDETLISANRYLARRHEDNEIVPLTGEAIRAILAIDCANWVEQHGQNVPWMAWLGSLQRRYHCFTLAPAVMEQLPSDEAENRALVMYEAYLDGSDPHAVYSALQLNPVAPELHLAMAHSKLIEENRNDCLFHLARSSELLGCWGRPWSNRKSRRELRASIYLLGMLCKTHPHPRRI